MKSFLERKRADWNLGETDSSRADPTRSARWPARVNLAAFWQQIVPIVPVLPTQPTRKCCSVYNLRVAILHGMEEVIGSIPIRSTNIPFKISYLDTYTPWVLPRFGVNWRQISRLTFSDSIPLENDLALFRLALRRFAAIPSRLVSTQLAFDQVDS